MFLIAALIFFAALIVRVANGTTLHDPWLYLDAGLMCISFGLSLVHGWFVRRPLP